jgi:hypothetical protein
MKNQENSYVTTNIGNTVESTVYNQLKDLGPYRINSEIKSIMYRRLTLKIKPRIKRDFFYNELI